SAIRLWAAWTVRRSLMLAACSLPYIPGVTSRPPSAGGDLRDANGHIVGSGVVLQQDDGVRVLLDVRNLPPGPKGIHIHEVGRCEPPSFTSAGGHFNPTNAQHGFDNPRGPHAGDLPNINVDADGQGHLAYAAPLVSLRAGPASLLGGRGTALVLHEGEDDNRTDPAGNSGTRIACGVVTRAG